MRILHAGLDWSYWGRLEPDCLDRPGRSQIAGGETAMLRAALETSARGHDVHVATWCRPGRHRGVRFHDNGPPGMDHAIYDLAFDAGPWDAVVTWGEPIIFAKFAACGALGGALRVCAQQCNGFAASDAVQNYVDRYVSPSRTHADMLARCYRIPREKFWVVPNAVEPSRYDFSRPRDPIAVYHASSPDRGLHHLLEAWPEVRRAEPRATLDVYYEYKRYFNDVKGVNPGHYSVPVMIDLVARTEAAMQRLWHGHGVTFHGGVPQQVVADRATTAGVMCYPCDPVIFTEGYGTAVLEAWCAGAEVVCSDADAFGEVYGPGGIGLDLMPRAKIQEETAPRVLAAIARSRGPRPSEADLRARLEAHSWRRVGERWCALLEGEMAQREKAMVAA